MGSLILKVIVIGLGASVSPVSIMVLISIMMTKNALKNALYFLLGFTVVLLAYGVISELIFHDSDLGKSHVGGYIDIVFGVLCFLAIILVFRRGRKPRGERFGTGIGAGKSFGIGAATMAVNTSTIIIFISGVNVVATSKVSNLDALIAMIVLVFFTLLTLFVPILIYVVFPEKSATLLEKLRGWLVRHNRVMVSGILALFCVYLLTVGILKVIK